MNLYLCIDGGGTRTRAGLYDAGGALLRESEHDPANPLAYGEAQTLRVVGKALSALGVATEDGITLAIGLAGAGDSAWRRNFARQLAQFSAIRSVRIASDLDPMLHANAPDCAAVFAIAGTGSSVLAKNSQGQVYRLGGRGTVFGDDGGGYAIAVRALRAAAHAHDGLVPATCLVEELPQALGLESFNALTPWSIQADKREVAGLAAVVNAAAKRGDAVARACLDAEAELLAAQVLAAANRAEVANETPLFLSGGVVENSEIYSESLTRYLEGCGGLIWHCPPPLHGHRALLPLAQAVACPDWAVEWVRGLGTASVLPTLEIADTPPLDELSAGEIVQVMCAADAKISAAVVAQSNAIARCIEAGAKALQSGGRIIYVGAGTSGRLGVLDASECPPTFGVPPERVLGVIAGGELAITQSVEGAEDDITQAERDLAALHPGGGDFVLGIAASGTTPYTRRALLFAKGQNAQTALLCCNPEIREGADILITMDTGAEALPGSTRLKAGTATKMALNIISTGAMARAGYIYRGRMVHMRPVNQKLRARAIRMLAELGGMGDAAAEELLCNAEWEVATALVMAVKGCDAKVARMALLEHSGLLRGVLGKSGKTR